MTAATDLAAQPLLDRAWEGASTTSGSGHAALREAAVRDAVHRACAVVAPLWPLDRFVAVNPFLGLSGRSFGEAAFQLARSTGARSVLTLQDYARLMAEGRFAEADIAAALAAQPGEGTPLTVAEILDALRAGAGPQVEPVPTIADCVDRLHGTRWTSVATDAISRFCAAHLDEGQAGWTSPWRGMELYAAWRSAAAFDLFPEAAGLAGFRRAVAQLPATPVATIDAVLATLGLGEQAATHYLTRALWSVHGWAAMIRQRHWGDDAGAEAALAGLLAIRLAWDAAILARHDGADIRDAMHQALATPAGAAARRALAVRLVLQEALEISVRRELFGRLGRKDALEPARPAAQAVFCIDVRSEVFRRSLEQAAPQVETLGFAGFFGFAVESVPFGATSGTPQCPVLLQPRAIVCEAVEPQAAHVAAEGRARRLTIGGLWQSAKGAAVSAFPFVEAAGLGHAAGLAAGALGFSRAAPEMTAGLDGSVAATLRPTAAEGVLAGRQTGMPLEQRIETAAGALRGMSLTEGFARLVLLCGHGSTSVNNPHRAGLDCGACGGQGGAPNARLAASVLNEPAVREALAGRGIAIPADTWFVAGLHDTTLDIVTLFDTQDVPASHASDLAALTTWLADAGARTRAARAGGLGLGAADDLGKAVDGRSRDWAQLRPEWGLAGNAAFIAAPRAMTRGIDLGGRAFLHSYEADRDTEGGILELIMVAPMVVASWINLQYYASTVDQDSFGAGDKTLHNVVAGLGVLEGRGGDLRTGLPLQSVHDGARFVHDPVRLNVLIAAAPEAMSQVLAKHAAVRQLVDNGWVRLFALGEDGRPVARYAGQLAWEEMAG